MSKRARNAILAGVALVALIGVLVVLLLLPPTDTEGGEETSTTTTPTTVKPLFDKSDKDGKDVVDYVTVTHDGESWTIRKNEDGVYCVVGYEDLPVYTSVVESFLKSVTTITPSGVIAEDAKDVGIFGLGTAATAVKVHFLDGEEYAFELGDDLVDKTGVYYREQGKNAVYVVANSFASGVRQAPRFYISKTLTTEPIVRTNDENGTAQLMKVEVSGKDREPLTVRFRRDTDPLDLTMGGNYVVELPYLVTGNFDYLNTWQTAFNSLKAADAVKAHPTAADWTAAGLDDRAVTVRLTLGVVTQKTDEETGMKSPTEVYNATTYTMFFGKKDENGNLYVRLDGVDVLYAIDPSAVPFVTATLDQVADESLVSVHLTSVSKVVYTAHGKTTAFDLTFDEEGKNLTLLRNGKGYDDNTAFQAYYATIFSQKRYKSIADTDADAFLAEHAAPDWRGEFTLSDGSSFTVDVYDYDANRCLVVRGERRYLMRAEALEVLLEGIQTIWPK